MIQLRPIILIIRSKISRGSVNELIWVLIGQTLNVILSFIIVKILSEMGADSYGKYALVISIAVFAGMVFHSPLAQGFIRFYYHYLAKALSGVFSEFIFKILLIASIVLLILTLVIFAISIFRNFYDPPLFFLAAGLYVITSKLTEFFNSVLNLIRKRKENSLLQGIEKITAILLFLLLLLFNKLFPGNVLFILSLTAFGFSALKYIVFKNALPKEERSKEEFIINARSEMRSRMYIYTSPFLIWGFSTWLQMNGEKWIINGFLSTADVGIYAVMLSLVTAFVTVPNLIISDFASPIIFQHFADMNKKDSINTGFHYIRINMLIIFMLTIFSTAFTSIWGRQLIILISRREYAVYWYLLPAICFGTGLFYTGQAQTILGLALSAPQKYLVPKVFAGIVSVILNYFLIKFYGINGAAYTIILMGFMYVAYISYVNKFIKLKFKF